MDGGCRCEDFRHASPIFNKLQKISRPSQLIRRTPSGTTAPLKTNSGREGVKWTCREMCIWERESIEDEKYVLRYIMNVPGIQGPSILLGRKVNMELHFYKYLHWKQHL